MHESRDRPSATAPQFPRALLLSGKSPFPEDQNLKELLHFFEIPWKPVSVGEITGTLPAKVPKNGFCILSSAHSMAEAMRGIESSKGAQRGWMAEANSVYIYGFQDTDPCRELLRLLTSDPQANIRNLNTKQVSMSVTGKFPDMCGPMSGMHVPVDLNDELVFNVAHQGNDVQSLITSNDGELFFRVTYRGIPFYLNACCKIVDIRSPSATYFDVKKKFCEAVPTAMYLKWAFRDVWANPETSGCLIVDDPVLKPRYGFLRFRQALELMDKHNFTTTIAFIPWNWRRTNSRTVAMFQRRPDRFSLSVHGCDHTASEFAVRSSALLNRRIKAASQRMDSLHQRTSLQCDRVMIFPQGEFSAETGRALKLNGFMAAVNTEVAPSNAAGNETRIADLWNVAIMKYGTFPIFTRRYMKHGIENFAFDALLGKPCLIVAHHDAFKRRGRELVDFIAKLNSLNWNLRWRSLGDAISHSFKVRNQADGTKVIQIFAESLVMENPSAESCEAIFIKEEGDPDCVKTVMVGETATDFSCDAGYLTFRVKLLPKQVTEVRIIYFDKLDVAPNTDGISYGIKTRVRRYLSEFRDNYLSQSEFVHKGATRIRRLLR